MTADQCTKLEHIPNIGPAIASDLCLIGISHPVKLKKKDPYKLYERLCHRTGMRHDPCVLERVMHFGVVSR